MLNLQPSMQIGKSIYLLQSHQGEKTTLFIFPLKIAMSSGGDKEFSLKVHRKTLIHSSKDHLEDQG